MSQIKGKNTKPELIVRKFLFGQGLRYRLHDKKLPGKPDIILRRYNAVVFIHGCFWHCHEGCRYFVIPKTKTEWWIEKLQKNASNDLISEERLRQLGWRIFIVWECELKSDKREKTLENLYTGLKKETMV